MGGKEGSLLGWSPLKSAELYDITTGAFIPVSDMTYARDRPRVAWVPAVGKALVIGGQQQLASGAQADVLPTEWFDPASNSFSIGPSLATGRMAHTLTELPDGSLLVAGGWNSTQGKTTNTAVRFVPDAASALGGSFVTAGVMASSRHDHGAALVNGKVLIAGGKKVEGATTWLSAAEVYSP